MNKLYHSALLKPQDNLVDIDMCWVGTSIALKHDIFDDDLPEDFHKTDVLYIEPAWQHGIAIFNDRAGVEHSYDEYVEKINDIIHKQNKPTIIICGKSVIKKFKTANQVIETVIRGAKNSKAVALVYNFTFMGDAKNTDTIVESLAKEFDIVGDFCCGYGNTGSIFYENGKDFVQSDYDGKCIDFIRRYYENI